MTFRTKADSGMNRVNHGVVRVSLKLFDEVLRIADTMKLVRDAIAAVVRDIFL